MTKITTATLIKYHLRSAGYLIRARVD